MAEELYALNAGDVQLLRDVVAAYRRGDLGRPGRVGSKAFLESASLYAAKTGGSAVPAASTGGVAGSAAVSLCTISTSGLISATTVAVTAYNLSSSTVAANTWIHIKREYMTGRWLIDFEDCG